MKISRRQIKRHIAHEIKSVLCETIITSSVMSSLDKMMDSVGDEIENQKSIKAAILAAIRKSMKGISMYKWPEAAMVVVGLIERNAILKIVEKYRVPITVRGKIVRYEPLENHETKMMIKDVSELLSSNLDYLKN